MGKQVTEQNILFLSELRHIDACKRFLDARADVREEGYLLIPLDAEIDYALAKEGIAFQSGKEYRTPDAARMILAEEWTSHIFESEHWAFFTYRGVSLTRLYFPQLQGYLNRVLYYTDIVSNVVAAHPHVARLIVFPSPHVPPTTARCLTNAMIDAIASVVTTVAAQSGKEVLVPETYLPPQAQRRSLSYVLKRLLLQWGFAALNIFMVLVRRPRRIRILASDYWRNLAPSLQYLDSAEVILTDRQEASNAGIANIWKFHMRFLHLDAFSQGISNERKLAQTLFKQKWQSIREGSDLSVYIFREFSMQPLLLKVLDNIIQESVTKTLKDVDDAHALIARLQPQIVMLRATVSSQTHFSILAQVARAQGIPSIEMQHGLMYFGPGSTGKRHSAQFMGVYGSLVQREMEEAGDKQSIPLIIGSPRFDVYASVQKNTGMEHITNGQEVTFLCIAPMVLLEEATDSYDVIEYFKAIAFALRKIPHVHAILKLRQGPNRGPFLRTIISSAFKGVSHTVAEFEPLSGLFSQADVVISGYSTAVLEALQCGKPLIYAGLCPLEGMTGLQHFLPYVKEGAMHFAFSGEELSHILKELVSNPDARKRLSENAHNFLAREYAFDGKASERTAAFIMSFASKEPQ